MINKGFTKEQIELGMGAIEDEVYFRINQWLDLDNYDFGAMAIDIEKSKEWEREMEREEDNKREKEIDKKYEENGQKLEDEINKITDHGLDNKQMDNAKWWIFEKLIDKDEEINEENIKEEYADWKELYL
jgi:hypothetical protein